MVALILITDHHCQQLRSGYNPWILSLECRVEKDYGRLKTINQMGYALSGEPTLGALYKRAQPFATAFMALFGRARLPHRSTLSRFLAAFDQISIEALRRLMVEDMLARQLTDEQPGGLWDRQGEHWLVFDVNGTRQAARQRAVPKSAELPTAARRLEK